MSDLNARSPTPESAPQPRRLFRARQVWFALLTSGTTCRPARWIDWADARIRDQGNFPPAWLFELSMAQFSDLALEALCADIDRDYDAYPKDVLDHEGLTIGFTYARHLAGELPLKKVLARVRETVDVAEFLDSGKWRAYAPGIAALDPKPFAPGAPWLDGIVSLARTLESQLIDQFDEQTS